MIKEVNEIKFKALEDYECKHCGQKTNGNYEYVESNKSIKATCSICDNYIKFMKQEQNLNKTKEDYRTDYLESEAATIKQIGKIKFMLIGISKRTAMRIIDILEVENGKR